jgi:hypothetical protein
VNRAGAEVSIVGYRSLAAGRVVKDCARMSIGAGVPTYLIDSDHRPTGQDTHLRTKRTKTLKRASELCDKYRHRT